MRTRILSALVLVPLLAGCEMPVDNSQAGRTAPPVAAAPVPVARPAGIAVGEFNPAIPATTTAGVGGPPTTQAVLGAPPPPAAEPAPVELASVEEDIVAPAPAGRLGTTIASLGSPTQSGLWLETPLVDAPTTGRIEYNGQSVTVELRPSGGEPGSGSQISVEAMRAIGASLTSLPELVVFSG